MAIKNFEAVISWIAAADYGAIVQHFQFDDSGSVSSFDAAKSLADGIVTPASGDSYLEALLGIMAENAWVSSIRTRRVGVAAPSFWRGFIPGAQPGVRSGNASPSQVAACGIVLTAGEAGLTGRNFYGAVSVEDVAGSRFTMDYKEAFSDVVTILQNPIDCSVGNFRFALKHGGTPTYTLAAHMYLSPQAGTQRRRLRPI